MKGFKHKLIYPVIILLLIHLMPSGLFALATTSATLQNSVTGNGNGTASDVSSYTTAVIQVSGTFTATINFEASVDGLTYTALQCFSITDSTSSATSVTIPGIWRCNIVGIGKVRARISGYGSGTITVKAMYNSVGVF